MYIFLGIVLLLIVLILLFADKFAKYSDMMSSFKIGTYKKLVISLSTLSMLFIAYGIYYEVTYQPPFLDIQVENNDYTVFGEIGEVGYFSNALIKKGKEADLHLVLWDDLNLNLNTEILIQYPSGHEVVWKAETTLIGPPFKEPLKEKYGIREIYQLSPYTFIENGKVKISIFKDEKETENLVIEVKEE